MNDPNPREPFFLILRLRAFLDARWKRVTALTLFLALFVFSSATLLQLAQRHFGPSRAPRPGTTPGAGLNAATSDLHTLVSGSLILAGLHPEDILHEESEEYREGRLHWTEYRREILVADHFPLEGWFDGLQASLDRAGARILRSIREDHLAVTILYRPEGLERDFTVEAMVVRVRPSADSLRKSRQGASPRAAIVIDDLGQNPAHLRRLSATGIPLTVSILPSLPYSKNSARKAAEEGMEILLHLPMEPFDFPEKRPGPGALLVEMTDDQMREQLLANLAVVPGAVGVNNHMGSRLTADARAMKVLMEVLRERGLFFLDSKTSPRSLAFDTAYQFNIPAAERDIFLDAYDDREFIRNQTRKLIEAARRRGAAIGIGHPYASTLEVLEEMKDEILASGIEWVPLSELVIQAYQDGPVSARD